MSRLTNANYLLQEFLPKVYIKQIEVYEDYLEMQFCVYLKHAEGEEPSEIASFLSDNVQFYYGAIFEEPIATAIINAYTPIYAHVRDVTSITVPVYDSDGQPTGETETLWDETTPTYGSVVPNYGKIDFDFSAAADSYYDSEGQQIYEYTGAATYHGFGPAWPIVFDYFEGLFEDAGATNTYTGLCIFSFSASAFLEMDSSDMELDMTGLDPLLINDRLKLANLGQVAYQEVFRNKTIIDPQETAFVFMDGNTQYQGEPLRTIGGALYDNSGASYYSIVQEVSNLINNTTISGNSTDTSSISILLRTNSYQDILPELNKVRKAWLSKDPNTSAGQFYEQFSSLILSLNRALKTGNQIRPQLFTNTTVIDRRYTSLETYDPDQLPGVLRAGVDDESDILYDEALIDRTYYTDENNDNQILDEGFIFFDYEKVMGIQCNISQVYHTRNVELLFGVGFTNSRLRLYSMYLSRYVIPSDASSEEDWEYKSTMRSFYKHMDSQDPESGHDTYYDGWPELYTITYDFNDENDLDVAPDDPYTSKWPNSGIALNTITPAGPAGLYSSYFDRDYRLMVFEFANYYPWQAAAEYAGDFDGEESGNGTGYIADLEIYDYTLDCVFALTSSYYSVYTGSLQDYFEMSAQFCSYNNITDSFNDFFVTRATELWPTNPPWESAPLIYNIHLDLLTNAFNGSKDEIVAASRLMSTNIGPANGTLANIAGFMQQFQSLYDDHYAENAVVSNIVETLEHQHLTFTTSYQNLPPIYVASGALTVEPDAGVTENLGSFSGFYSAYAFYVSYNAALGELGWSPNMWTDRAAYASMAVSAWVNIYADVKLFFDYAHDKHDMMSTTTWSRFWKDFFQYDVFVDAEHDDEQTHDVYENLVETDEYGEVTNADAWIEQFALWLRLQLMMSGTTSDYAVRVVFDEMANYSGDDEGLMAAQSSFTALNILVGLTWAAATFNFGPNGINWEDYFRDVMESYGLDVDQIWG
tara:strand:- start:6276 stop:9227 length:2952 start_codon:yes stop_codon:yes gene_type:complete